ncbi:hypothetical protein, partial [Lutimonas sp.]|uniref:hypothetical protein n=1 Tax=Lutimonas sp. TaxID=1872403 RepID=UPI003C76579E
SGTNRTFVKRAQDFDKPKTANRVSYANARTNGNMQRYEKYVPSSSTQRSYSSNRSVGQNTSGRSYGTSGRSSDSTARSSSSGSRSSSVSSSSSGSGRSSSMASGSSSRSSSSSAPSSKK